MPDLFLLVNFSVMMSLSSQLFVIKFWNIDNSNFSSELDRVLVSGGKLVIGVPQKKGYLKDPDHKIFYSIAKLKNLSTTYNLSLSYKTHFSVPLPFAFFGNFLSSNYLYVIFKKL